MWERAAISSTGSTTARIFYVCGDAKAMAKDVRATLVRAYADVKAAFAGGRRAGGRAAGARQALSAGRILILRLHRECR